MTNVPNKYSASKLKLWTNIISIFIPLAVALLFTIKWDQDQLILMQEIILLENLPIAKPLNFLPPIYASINGLTAALLIVALIAIKNKRISLHESIMKTAISCSVLFLLMYIAYHITSDPTPYGGSGLRKFIYYFILITHIVLSIAVIPLVLYSYIRAYLVDYKAHKKIVKYAYPIWLYVAITGVVIYLMISPYYV
jgi:putative membrane protein